MKQYVFSKESCGSLLRIDCMASSDPSQLVQDCFLICDVFEERYSRFKPGNRLDTINKKQEEPIELNEQELMMIGLMIELAQKTGGKFDPTVISTLESYGYDKDYSFQKKQGGPVGYRNVELIDNNLILHKGVRIEFGTVGKGYLLDVLATEFQKAGIEQFLLNFGGDIYAQGVYQVGLENPFNLDQAIGSVAVDGFAVASSNGKKRAKGDFHHLLNAVTGKPEMDIAGVYIAAKTGLIADAYSTAVFVSGPEKGVDLLQSTADITGLIVFANGSYRMKEGYSGKLFS